LHKVNDMAIFSIGAKDYSSYVVDESYKINSIPQYKSWTDGYGNRHRDQRPAKHSGSVDLFFKSMTDYSTFLSDLATAKYNAENQYTLTVKANNLNPTTEVTIHAFVDFEGKRALKGDFSEYMEKVTLKIEES